MKISVITPSFNNSIYLNDAIESVITQNYANFEHIVIDAASTDDTLEILKSHSHLRWISESDKGQSDALNKGIALATGDIIVILNADDYFLPNAFNTIIPYFKKGASFIVGDVCIINSHQNTKIIHPKIDLMSMLHHWKSWIKIDNGHYSSNFPNNPVQYFYVKSLHDTLDYNVDNHLTMDLEFLLQATSLVKMKKIEVILGVYRMLDETKTIQSMKNSWSYWSIENFSYIDIYLLNFTKEEIIEFKNEQLKGYNERIFQKPQLVIKILNQLAILEKLPIIKYPFKKLFGFKKLLSLYRDSIRL